MNLTKEDIQFIGNYLLKSEVFYADIRAEMTDHIATAVEVKMETENLDFYDAFKEYMAVNKKEILKANKGSMNLDLSVLKHFGKFLITPKMLVFDVFFGFGMCFISKNYCVNFLQKHPFLFGGSILILAFLQAIYFYGIAKRRFYYLEKSGIILTALSYFIVFIINPELDNPNFYIAGTYVYFFSAYILYVIYEVTVFAKNNKNIYA
ncbi:hypothetical protein [Flavobacterium sp. 3HN19-14]|uniref:hypothetical protein n=1 Tax=Flavobacterium sp. 3HN19-14 TaxID=3448133 RepID=UPI003EDFD4A6